MPDKDQFAKAIEMVAKRLSDEHGNRLLQEFRTAAVTPINSDSSIIRFDFPHLTGKREGGQESYGVNLSLVDQDGEEILLDIFYDCEGTLYELELIKFAGGPVIEPKWESLSYKY